MDAIRERFAGWASPYPGGAAIQAGPEPVALEAIEFTQASLVAGGPDAAPWRSGDWLQVPQNIVRDGLAPIGALPPAGPETTGEWFSRQLGAIATLDPGVTASFQQTSASGQDAGSGGLDGQSGQNQTGNYGPFPGPYAPPPVGPAQAMAAPAGFPEMRPDYALLAIAQAPPGHAIVQIGDSLPKIARRLLGDESRWVEIFELNRDQILNQDVILPGMVLRLPQGDRPSPPPALPRPQPRPPRPAQPAEPNADAEALRRVTPEQLAYLGATDKARFFEVLKPAAVAAEQRYGVPWQVTLAQVALESGWGKHGIGGYNVFGIKGTGPAGSVVKSTKEWRNGRYVTENARFAKYHDYYEAIMEHGKLFHNGYYQKAMTQFQRDRDPIAFARNIHGIYATSPTYAQNLITLMRQYNLV